MGAPEARPISEARLDTLRTKAQRASSTTLPPAPASVAVLDVARDVRRPPFARVSLDAEAESSVADECLASIRGGGLSRPRVQPAHRGPRAGLELDAGGAAARSVEPALARRRPSRCGTGPAFEPALARRRASRRGVGRRSSAKHRAAAPVLDDGDDRAVVVVHLARVAAPGGATAAAHAVVAVVVVVAARVSVGAGPLARWRG